MSLNKFLGIGNVTADPEVRGKDKKFTTFSIAINDTKDSVTFVNCVAFSKIISGNNFPFFIVYIPDANAFIFNYSSFDI